MFRKKDIFLLLSLLVFTSATILFFILNREQFIVGSTKAIIDNKNKIIFVALPEGSQTKQLIKFNFPLKNKNIYIKKISCGSNIYNNKNEEKLENKSIYNFENFIHHSKIIIKSKLSNVEYDLWITTGNIPILIVNSEKQIVNEPKVRAQIRVLAKNPLYNSSILNSEIELVDINNDIKKFSYSFNILSNNLIRKTPQLLDFEPSKRFTLSSLWPDDSLIRQKLSYEVFKSLSPENIAPDSWFIELILNNKYEGVYLLSRRVDKDMFNLENFDKNELKHSVIYEASNKKADFSMGITGFSQIEPDEKKDIRYSKPLEELIDNIINKDSNQFENWVYSNIDIDNLIDNHILFLLSGNSNSLASNQYIYRSNKNKDKFKFCPGDYYNFGFGIDTNLSKTNATDIFSEHDYITDYMKIKNTEKD